MIIYLITNKINGKQYVGQTTRPLKTRFAEHATGSKDYVSLINQAIIKYGKKNFHIDQIDTAQSLEELDGNPAWNKGLEHSEETKQKISEANKIRAPRGSTHSKTKLTEEEVRAIKKMLSLTEYTQRKIASLFNVSEWVISDIKRGRTWLHVT